MNIRKKMYLGVKITLIRQVLSVSLNIVGQILVARVLSPKDYGIFATFTFLSNLLLTFGFGGILSAFIQQDHEPSNNEYKTAFSSQMAYSLVLSVALLCLLPLMRKYLDLGESLVIATTLLVISFIMNSATINPSIKLHRSLKFKEIASIEIAQLLVFNLVLITMVYCGYGGISFAWAMFFKSLIGLIGFFLYEKMGFTLTDQFDKNVCNRLFSFVFHFQGISIVSTVKDSFIPIFIGGVVGTSAIGQIDWATKVACYPVLIMMIFQKVYLPVFSRAQKSNTELASLGNSVVFYSNFLVSFFSIAIFILITPAVKIVFGTQWLSSINIFYLLWFPNLFLPTTVPVISLLQAKGFSSAPFYHSLAFMAATWILGMPLVWKFGVIGFCVVNILVQLANFPLIAYAHRACGISVYRNVYPSWVIGSFVGFVIWGIFDLNRIETLNQIIPAICLYVLLYGILVYVVYKNRIFRMLKELRA